jgi:hypothetical protein
MKKKVKPFNTVTYKGLAYVTRTFVVMFEGEKHTFTIATELLSEAMGQEWDEWGSEAHKLDNQIYFYLEGEKITLSGKEICEKHLDEPMKFVREIF